MVFFIVKRVKQAAAHWSDVKGFYYPLTQLRTSHFTLTTIKQYNAETGWFNVVEIFTQRWSKIVQFVLQVFEYTCGRLVLF